jgi:protein-S-isoprenylcysteine O-methyltransferase Ste14
MASPVFDHTHRFLQDEEEPWPPVWETILVSVVLLIMFVFMLKDWVGPDWVMITGLTIFMVTEIVDIKEGLQGFSNEG